MNVCRSCPEPLSPRSRRFCETHRLKENLQQRARREARRKEGTCIACENLEEKSGLCSEHYKKMLKNSRNLYQRRRDEGQCPECHRPALKGRSRCEVHQLKGRIRARERWQV